MSHHQTTFMPTPSRSSSLPLIHAIFSRKSLFYNRLPSLPLRLSVLKLDGSSFHIQVSKTATVAQLKDAVEAVFSHAPLKGPAQISWAHVWGQFCLCYDGQKLVTENDYLRNYGIKDGDQRKITFDVKELKMEAHCTVFVSFAMFQTIAVSKESG